MKIGQTALRALAASISLAACSNPVTPEQTEAKLKAATAEALGEVNADVIAISNQKGSMSRWVWEAKANGKTYACDADNFFRLPSCQQADQSTSLASEGGSQ